MQCTICLQKFNTEDRQPYDVCYNRHSYCRVCVDYVLSADGIPRCPECRSPIKRKDVMLNRAANAIISQIGQHDRTVDVMDSQQIKLQSQIVAAKPTDFRIRFFLLKLLLTIVLAWATPIITWVYLFNLGGYFRLALMYFIIFKFYQLWRNKTQFQLGKSRLLLKLGLFGFMDEVEQGEKVFYAQFALRWVASVTGIVFINSYYTREWSILAIVAICANLLSVLELWVCRLYLKRFLDYASQPDYQWLTSITLVTLLLLSLVSSIINLIHLGISWYPAVIIYITCWIATLIYYVNGQGKSCCPNATTIFFLFISFAYSIGMFCWLAIKHCLNRIPAYAMLVIRYLVCPLISLALVVIPITNNTFEHENLTMVAQMLSTMELGLGIYLISR